MVRGSSPSQLRSDFSALARQLLLQDESVRSADEPIKTCSSWLRTRDKWLLVIDDLEESGANMIDRWLPPPMKGQLIITSRHSGLTTSHWRSHLRLDALPVEAATELLISLSHQADESGARMVAEKLAGLPLALETCVSYMKIKGIDFRAYGVRFDGALEQTRHSPVGRARDSAVERISGCGQNHQVQ